MLKTEELKLVSEWDKTFPQSEKVDHTKVTFVNRYGITLAADLYKPKNVSGQWLKQDINTEDFMAAVDFLSVQEDVDSDKIGIIGICGRLTHAYFHLIPLNPLEFGGIFYVLV